MPLRDHFVLRLFKNVQQMVADTYQPFFYVLSFFFPAIKQTETTFLHTTKIWSVLPYILGNTPTVKKIIIITQMMIIGCKKKCITFCGVHVRAITTLSDFITKKNIFFLVEQIIYNKLKKGIRHRIEGRWHHKRPWKCNLIHHHWLPLGMLYRKGQTSTGLLFKFFFKKRSSQQGKIHRTSTTCHGINHCTKTAFNILSFEGFLFLFLTKKRETISNSSLNGALNVINVFFSQCWRLAISK